MRLSTRRMAILAQVRSCLDGNEPVDYRPLDREGAYEFVRATLETFGYQGLGRTDRGTIRRYLAKFSGLSLQVCIDMCREDGAIPRGHFPANSIYDSLPVCTPI